MRLLLIVLACVLGCGSSDDSIYPLAGSAWIQRLGDRKCDHQLTFSEDGQYLEAWICILGDYSEIAEVNKGTYHINGHTLTVDLDQSSCSTDASGTVDFSINGDLHIFTSAGGIIMMARLIFPPGEPAAEIPLGCFDDTSWAFTPMAIHSI